MSPTKIVITWYGPWGLSEEEFKERGFDELPEDRGVYMMLAGGKILYMGKVYDQNFYQRVYVQHYGDRTYRCVQRRARGKRISFKGGIIKPITLSRVTRELVDDVE